VEGNGIGVGPEFNRHLHSCRKAWLRFGQPTSKGVNIYKIYIIMSTIENILKKLFQMFF